jgi:cytoskeletal protein RodZ
MALSMDEQRVLAEIEKRLAAEEPALAACMTAFRRPGPGLRLKSPRARILGSLFTVALVAVISLMVYAMLPFRTHPPRPPGDHSVPGQTSLTASSHPSSAGATSAGAASVAVPANQPASHAAAHATTAGAPGAKAVTGAKAATGAKSVASAKTTAATSKAGTANMGSHGSATRP